MSCALGGYSRLHDAGRQTDFCVTPCSGRAVLGVPTDGNRMFNRSAFAQGGPATLRLHLRAQLLLELFVLADAQASPLPVRGFGTLSAQGARITRRSRKLGMLARATTSCGATTSSGATTSCGATTSSGVTTSCGGKPARTLRFDQREFRSATSCGATGGNVDGERRLWAGPRQHRMGQSLGQGQRKGRPVMEKMPYQRTSTAP